LGGYLGTRTGWRPRRRAQSARRRGSGRGLPPHPRWGWGAKARGHYPQLELLLNRVATSRTTGHRGWATGGAGGKAPNPNPAGAGPGGRPRRRLPGRLQPSWCPPPYFPTPPYSRARMRASGVHRRWSSHPALVGGGAPSSEYGATEGAGGAVISGACGPSLRLPIKRSAFAVFLGAEFYLAELPAEATFRLSAGGLGPRLTLLMPALTLLMPALSLTAHLWRTGRSATAAKCRPPFRLAS